MLYVVVYHYCFSLGSHILTGDTIITDGSGGLAGGFEGTYGGGTGIVISRTDTESKGWTDGCEREDNCCFRRTGGEEEY